MKVKVVFMAEKEIYLKINLKLFFLTCLFRPESEKKINTFVKIKTKKSLEILIGIN